MSQHTDPPLRIRAVAFDWGDTVMEDPGTDSGPMARWPHVAAVEGVADALERLAPSFRLAIATNAEESDAELVRAALDRVGLAGWFETIVASCEVGHRKPARSFYAALCTALGCRPAETVMVGDDYRNDVTGAHRAGLRTVWLDRSAETAPVSEPLHDARITSMAQLPATVHRLSTRH